MRQRFMAAMGMVIVVGSLTGCYARPFGGGYNNNCCCPQPTCCQYGTPTGTTAYYNEPPTTGSSVAAANQPTPATARVLRGKTSESTVR
ncbi:MAG: hypothetical protein AB7O62_24155 [Pirellulales bacterium]